MRAILILIALIVTPAANASLYKCTDNKGARTYSQVPCAPTAEKIYTGDTSDPGTSDSPSQRQQVDPDIKAELRRLNTQEDRIFARRNERRQWGVTSVTKSTAQSENDELDSIRRQKRALLGQGGPGDEQETRLRKLERTMERPSVENFTLNGRPCEKVGSNVQCH